MYLYFDDPNDQAISQLEHLDRLTIIRCSESYWLKHGMSLQSLVQQKQQQNATNAFKMARSAGIKWLIHVDHDELIYGPKSLHDYFFSIPDSVDVINFPVMEAMPQKLNYKHAMSEIRYFKVFDALPSAFEQFSVLEFYKNQQRKNATWWHRKRRVARLFGSNHAKLNDGKYFLHGHQVGKSATNTSASIESIGCHLPLPKKHSTPVINVSQQFYVLHYDCMGFESWEIKWGNRLKGSANFDTNQFSSYRNSILNRFKNHLENETLKHLYKNFYYLNRYEKLVLQTTGLLRKIHHDPALFEAPSSD